jgi:hypothetical protein
LYHYTGQVSLLSIINTAELWATKVQYMNDATEFNLALSMARQILDDRIGATLIGTPITAYAQLRDSLTGLEDINIFAACFCEDGDLLSQWRGYADAGGGSSIGFDSYVLTEAASCDGFTLGKCIYDTSIQRTIVTHAIEHCLQDEQAVPSQRQWGFHGPLADVLFRYGAFFKDPSFAEEKEWRLVSPTINFRHDRICFRAGRSTITPYYKLSIKRDGCLPIGHIIVGPCPHMDLAKSAVTAALMQQGMHGPLRGQEIVFGSKIPFRNW